jgi:dephospho-CoA kinase
MQRDGITAEKAREWMAKQWAQEEVRRRAHYEIVNDGLQDLNSQIDSLLTQLYPSPITPENSKQLQE